MTTAEFAKTNELFKAACEIANRAKPKNHQPIFATSRQASKFRNGQGVAFRYRGTAASILKRKNLY